MRLGKYAVLACFMMAMGFAATQVQAAVPKAYWKFEGSNPGRDWTGNGFTATLMGDAKIDAVRPTAASMNGQTTGSLLLSGTGYCQIANPAGLTIGQANFSLSFWYKVAGTNNTASMCFFSKSNNGLGATGAKFMGINGGGNNGKISYDNWGSGGSYYGAKATMHDGNWHHVVITQRARTAIPAGASETLKVYVDGAVPPTASTPDINTSQTTILDTAITGTPNPTVAIGLGTAPGGTTNGGTFNFVGWIDDMKFFDVCLSPNDVVQEYGKNTCGVSSVTVTPLTAGNVVFPTISTITGPNNQTVNVLVKNNNAAGFSPLEFTAQTATDPQKGMLFSGAAAARYTIASAPTPVNWNTVGVGVAPQGTLTIPVKFTPVFASDFNPLVDSTQYATLSLYTNINGTPKLDIPLKGPLVPVGMSSFSAK